MNKTTFIYALTCPDTDEIRYIGKANNPQYRLRCHLGLYGSKKTHKNNWVKSLLDSGKRPGMVILEEVDLTEWQSAERRWIEYHRSLGANLTNIADGGQGGDTSKSREKSTIERVRFSVELSDDLVEWLTEQATLNHRSVNKQIEYFLDTTMNDEIDHYDIDKYHLLWADYDGVKGESFTDKEQLEKRYTEIAEKSEQYGTNIIGVYFGKWVELVPTEVRTIYKVKE